jgi:hypothetical protein
MPEYTLLTDIFIEPEEGLSPEHLILARRASETAWRESLEKVSLWSNACENCCAALDKNGRPGFLLLVGLNRAPSAHRLLELHEAFSKKNGLADMTVDYLKPNESFSYLEGPALLAFVPGIETLHADIEYVYEVAWGRPGDA